MFQKLFSRNTINGLYDLAEETSVTWGETKRSGKYLTLSFIMEEGYSGLNILSVTASNHWFEITKTKEIIEIIWNANFLQQGNFIDVFLARQVSGTYAHHQEH